MLDIVKSYHYIQFQQTWEMTKNLVLGPIVASFGLNLVSNLFCGLYLF